MHSSEPLLPLRTPELVDALRTKLAAEPQYLQQLVQRVFLDNPHRESFCLLTSVGFSLILPLILIMIVTFTLVYLHCAISAFCFTIARAVNPHVTIILQMLSHTPSHGFLQLA